MSLLLSALVIVAAISAGSYYRASGSSHDTTFYACLYAGSLSQVGTTPPANCGRGQQVQWNAEGPPGATGAPGAGGINCWDLNGNRVNDPAEDVNGDGNFDTLDCTGPQGEQGPPGPSNELDCAECVDTTDIALGAVVGGDGGVVQDGSISSHDLATNAVVGGPGGDVQDGSLTADDLALNAVVGGPGGDVLDGSITAQDLANGSVPTSKQVANASQGVDSPRAIGPGFFAESQAFATINTQDTVAHTMLVTVNARVRCFSSCQSSTAQVQWILLASDGVAASVVIAGPYTESLTESGDILTIAQTMIHIAQGPQAHYILRIVPVGTDVLTTYGMTVTAVDLGRTP